MPIEIRCDTCGASIAEYQIGEEWELQKYRQAESIICEDCEETWSDYEKELRSLEEKVEKDLEEKKEALKSQYFDKRAAKRDSDSVRGRMEEGQGQEPANAFKTLRK